jgi:hypothetical protein
MTGASQTFVSWAGGGGDPHSPPTWQLGANKLALASGVTHLEPYKSQQRDWQIDTGDTDKYLSIENNSMI